MDAPDTKENKNEISVSDLLFHCKKTTSSGGRRWFDSFILHRGMKDLITAQ
jgi:hypothetical protein